MTYPLVRELAADGIPVRLTCGVLGFSTQGFYKWQAAPICARDYDEAHVTNAIVDVHRDDPCFGYRFISDEPEQAGHWKSRSELHYAAITWIKHTYNRRRRQRALGQLTPVEFELAFAERQAAWSVKTDDN